MWRPRPLRSSSGTPRADPLRWPPRGQADYRRRGGRQPDRERRPPKHPLRLGVSEPAHALARLLAARRRGRRRSPSPRSRIPDQGHSATADMLVIARRVLIVAQFSALLPNLRRLGISPHRVRNPRSAGRMGHGRRVKSESRVLINSDVFQVVTDAAPGSRTVDRPGSPGGA